MVVMLLLRLELFLLLLGLATRLLGSRSIVKATVCFLPIMAVALITRLIVQRVVQIKMNSTTYAVAVDVSTANVSKLL